MVDGDAGERFLEAATQAKSSENDEAWHLFCGGLAARLLLLLPCPASVLSYSLFCCELIAAQRELERFLFDYT